MSNCVFKYRNELEVIFQSSGLSEDERRTVDLAYERYGHMIDPLLKQGIAVPFEAFVNIVNENHGDDVECSTVADDIGSMGCINTTYYTIH